MSKLKNKQTNKQTVKQIPRPSLYERMAGNKTVVSVMDRRRRSDLKMTHSNFDDGSMATKASSVSYEMQQYAYIPSQYVFPSSSIDVKL